MISVAEVEAEVARRIAALDATAYQQGATVPSWTEGERYGEDGPESVAHLLFHALIEDSPSTGQERDGPKEYARLRSRCVVVFTYRLRVNAQLTDSRLARDAAHDVARALNAPWREANVVLVNLGRPAISDDGSFLAMALEFDIYHEIEV